MPCQLVDGQARARGYDRGEVIASTSAPYSLVGRHAQWLGPTYVLQAPWMAVFPGIAISLAVFGFNMLGDALRDLLDPKIRGGPERRA